jgi:hypothetical protein
MSDERPSWSLRLARAKEHFDLLNAELDRFLESNTYTIDAERRKGHIELRAGQVTPVPAAFGPIVGDCLHNLRSALDHLAFQLSAANCEGQQRARVERATAFPIFDDAERFGERDRQGRPSRRSGLWKMQGMAEEVREAIEALQPFNSSVPAGQYSYLSLLRDLSDTDKHREPQLVVPILARGTIEISGEGVIAKNLQISRGPLVAGGVLATASLSGSEDLAYVSGRFEIGVSFAPGFPGQQMDVRLTIERIAQLIEHQIVPALAVYL